MRGEERKRRDLALRAFEGGLIIAILLSMSPVCLAQDQSQKRGYTAAGSFALSDIETINTVNGNLILNFPLGKLSPGRGGMSADINLLYNSKLHETHVEYVLDARNQLTAQNFLNDSEAGGWRYGFHYDPRLLNRLQGDDYPPQCPDAQAIYIWKLQMIFPDGNSREFPPTGYVDNYGDGYFTIRPDGWATSCSGGTQPSVTTGMTYYSTDGSFMRLFFPYSPGSYWSANWTLSMPDGSRVVSTQGVQRIYDRNSNYIDITSVTNYNNSTHPATVIADQLGRTVAVEYDSAARQDYIYSSGVNGEQLKWTVKWKTIYVNRGYRTTGAGITRGGTSWQSTVSAFNVIDRITLPTQAGALTYVFGYNGNDTQTTSLSYGFGELTSITLPSLAQSSYHFFLDTSTPPTSGQFPNTSFVLNNYPTSKTLSYQLEYDGAVTPTTETWQYAIDTDHTTSTITAPDGGVTTETHGTTAYQNSESGLNYQTVRPDGTVVEHIWQQNPPMSTNVGANPGIKTEFTSIKTALGSFSKTAIKDYNYDKNGNVTRVAQYDWVDYSRVPRDVNGRPTGIPAAAVVKRVITNTYSRPTPDASDSTSNTADSYWNFSSPNLRNAIASSEISSDGTQTLARTEFYYDNPATTGNLTQQTSWDSTKGGLTRPLTTANWISGSHQYGNYGNRTLTTDARGYQTQFIYGLVGGFTDLYPTQIKAAYQTSVQRMESREYDFYTGVVTRVTDSDNNVSTSTTYDPFGRPVLVRAAENKPEETRAATEYSDAQRRVIVRADLNSMGDGKLLTIQHYDQLGRIRLSRQLEDSATQSATDETVGIKVQTRYKYSGSNSYQLVSNPYRASYSSSAGSEVTMGWTRTKADSGGRVIEVQTFGGRDAADRLRV